MPSRTSGKGACPAPRSPRPSCGKAERAVPSAAGAMHRTGERLDTRVLGWPRSTKGQDSGTHLGLASHLRESLKEMELETKMSILMWGSWGSSNFFTLISVTLLVVNTSWSSETSRQGMPMNIYFLRNGNFPYHKRCKEGPQHLWKRICSLCCPSFWFCLC